MFFCQRIRSRRGFTLIELIMVLVIIGILASAGSYVLAYVVQNSVFMPNQLNMDMLVADAADIMFEGDQQAKGLRFSKAITNIQAYQVTFQNQDDQTIRYRLNTNNNRLYRSINGAAEQLLPYYIASGASLLAKNNRLFTYYDANNVVTSNPLNVRLITATLIARTGTGLYANWEGQSEQASAVAVKRFQ